MLEAALKQEKTFKELEIMHNKYIEELSKGNGVPTFSDWKYIWAILPFLKIFYDATLRISGSTYLIYIYAIGLWEKK